MTDAPLMTLAFTLPWPPSVNTYWRHIVLGGKFKKPQARVLLSEQGRKYQVDALVAIHGQRVPRGAVKGRLAVAAVAYPPDRRARDLDNVWKGLLDALYHAGVIRDDADIDELSIRRATVRPGGLIELRVSEIACEPEQLQIGDGVVARSTAGGASQEALSTAATPPPF